MGDEVLKVNGLSVKNATHREVVSVIRNSSFVQLRVRGEEEGGMGMGMGMGKGEGREGKGRWRSDGRGGKWFW